MIARTAVLLLVAAGVAGFRVKSLNAPDNPNVDVDIKLASRYCHAAQEAHAGPIDWNRLVECMREFGYSGFQSQVGRSYRLVP